MAKPQSRTLSEFLRAEILRLLDEMTFTHEADHAHYEILAESDSEVRIRFWARGEVVTLSIESTSALVSSPEVAPDAG